jgi:hypothetical protein
MVDFAPVLKQRAPCECPCPHPLTLFLSHAVSSPSLATAARTLAAGVPLPAPAPQLCPDPSPSSELLRRCAMADPTDMEGGDERYETRMDLQASLTRNLSTDASRSRNFADPSVFLLLLIVVRVRLFCLEIKVQGFCSTHSDGSKSYTKPSVIK